MSLPALQQFEHLSAELKVRSAKVVRQAEVVSFSLGSLVRKTNDLIGIIDRLRINLIRSKVTAERLTKQDLYNASIQDVARVRALLKRWRRQVSRPMLAVQDGATLVSLAESLETAKLPLVADRRLARKLARRIRDHADACESQRVRLEHSLSELINLIEDFVASSELFDEYEEAYMDELVSASIERYPVINAYLAR